MAKFKFWVSTGYVGSEREDEVEIEDSELEDMNETERESYIQSVYEDWVWENVNGGWEELDKDV